MKVIFFEDKTQFIIFPAIGIVNAPDGFFFTIAIATVGLSFRVWRKPHREDDV